MVVFLPQFPLSYQFLHCPGKHSHIHIWLICLFPIVWNRQESMLCFSIFHTQYRNSHPVFLIYCFHSYSSSAPAMPPPAATDCATAAGGGCAAVCGRCGGWAPPWPTPAPPGLLAGAALVCGLGVGVAGVFMLLMLSLLLVRTRDSPARELGEEKVGMCVCYRTNRWMNDNICGIQYIHNTYPLDVWSVMQDKGMAQCLSGRNTIPAVVYMQQRETETYRVSSTDRHRHIQRDRMDSVLRVLVQQCSHQRLGFVSELRPNCRIHL